jgi:rare lipoprotein A
MEAQPLNRRYWTRIVAVSATTVLLAITGSGLADPAPPSPTAQQEAERLAKLPPVGPHAKGIDHSGRTQKGKASYYGPGFADKTMANGRPMNPHSNTAASKTLPLGTTAKVVNLDNGKTATVHIGDRGPYVDGRVVDVTPKTATHLHMKERGVAPVAVKPIVVPQKDGGVKLGSGAAEATPEEIQHALEQTRRLSGQTEAAAK